MKDHEISKVVNELRDIAVQYHDARQLRERIAHVVVPLLAAHNAGAQEPVAQWQYRFFDGVKWVDWANCTELLVKHKDGRDDFQFRALFARAHPQPMRQTDAARDVLAERRRHVEVEGWTPEHDDAHDPGTLASAGCAYAGWAADMLHPYSLGDGDRDREGAPPAAWPFTQEWWKPTSPRRALEKAAALILAEIERLDRAKGE